MKLKDLAGTIRSVTGDIVFCVVYDYTNMADLAKGCSAEYAYAHHGELEVRRAYPIIEDGIPHIVFAVN